MTDRAPRHAILLAAGLGIRMRPLTDATAKTLLPLAGRTLLDRALDRLADADVERVLVNAHWRADRVAAHLAARTEGPETILLPETELLDTGGTVAAALAAGHLPPDRPFFVVNGDGAWFDGPAPALTRLANGFDPSAQDGCLLMVRAAELQAEVLRGDFLLDPMGVPRRPLEREIAPFVFAGVQILSPRLFVPPPSPPVSLNALWDRAIAAGRLGAIVHDGVFFHLSTPRDLAEAEHGMEERLSGFIA